MRAWLILAILALGVSFSADSADAQQRFCRYDDSGTVCVCRRGAGWRISPEFACRGRRAAPPREFLPERDDPDFDPPRVEPEPRARRSEPRRSTPRRSEPAQPTLTAAQRRERAEIEQIQRVLNALGCEAGTPDGVIGRGTRAAIRCFQAGAARRITGSLDGEERRALLAAHDWLPAEPRTLLADLRTELGSGDGEVLDVAEADPAEVDPAETEFVDDELIAEQDDPIEDLEPIAEAEGSDDGAPVEDILASLREDDGETPNAAPSAATDPASPPTPVVSGEAPAEEQSEPAVVEAEPAGEEAAVQEVAAASEEIAAQPEAVAEPCTDGFVDGVWTYQIVDGRGRAVASATTQTGASIAFVVQKEPISWRIEVIIADDAYLQTVVETAQYLFIQTDKPAAIGFEDVSEFQGRTLTIPVGSANTLAMLGSQSLTLSAAAKRSSPSGELTLFDLTAVETDGLSRVLGCF